MSVVVTGAVSGIGRAIVEHFSARGETVVAVDVDGQGLDDLVSYMSGPVVPLKGDVAEPATHSTASDLAQGGGQHLTGWVNNAAIALSGSIHDLEEADYRRLMSVNLDGYVWGCQAAVRSMLVGGSGAIVNISSTQAKLGFGGYPGYAAAKGAVEALTRQVAAEYASRQIRCNAVAPGVIFTEMNERILAESEDPEALRRAWDALCPVGRWGQPEDVAEAVGFLLDPARAGFITGEVISVDGGQTIIPPGGA